MRITWFGHSAYRVETGSSVVMIDPFLSGNPTWEGSVEDAANGATHVVLTHGHDDHIGDTLDICKTTGATLVGNAEIATYFARKGVENVSPGNHGGRIRFEDFTVAFVQAWHSSSSRAGEEAVYLGNPAGIVIIPKSGKTLYHMGDTDIFSDMALINEIYEPKIGIVPIGDRFTMGAELAAMACRKFFRFETVIPCHFGTFPIIDQTPDKFIAEMKGHNVVVPERGVAVDL
jgi:L-ascorbate metabolism protein UlaG (beta-lactamase superfamily)